jgi:hypothetical protein
MAMKYDSRRSDSDVGFPSKDEHLFLLRGFVASSPTQVAASTNGTPGP